MRQANGLTCVLALALALAGCARTEPADTIVTAARIYTLAGPPPARAEDEPAVDALAIRNGAIVAAGDRATLRALAGPQTRMVDFGTATVLPGFADCHVHLASLGRTLRTVDLVGTTSWKDAIARVAASARDAAPGTWILGRGWDQNDWVPAAFPDHEPLSAAVPAHPVWLVRIDGHAAIANGRALEIAALTRATTAPPGGRIVWRPSGEPTGVLVDAAMTLVDRHIPVADAAERRARLRLALEHASRAGLTTVHDAGFSVDDVEDLAALQTVQPLPVRVYGMWDATPEAGAATVAEALRRGPVPAAAESRLALRCVKLSVDGALGSRGAALLEPYADAPGEIGLPQYTLDGFLARARPFHAAGYQLATHAIGDAANRLVLDAYAQLQAESPRADARHRIEHAQVLAPADIGRFATQNVLPSMQPTHCTSDMPWAGARLGPERVRGAYAWRSLRQTGVLIPAGSDAPVEEISPLAGIYAAVTRRGGAGSPPTGWSPEQRLTRSEALRAFTSWAAFAGFADTWCGTLEAGKRADLVVVDRDLLRCAEDDIAGTRILATLVDGRDALAPAPPAAAASAPTH